MKNKWVKVAAAVLIFAMLLWLSVQGSSSQLRKKVAQYKAQLREAGEKTTVEEITPPPVSAEKNALALFQSVEPFLRSGGNDCIETNPPTGMHLISPGRAMVGFQQPQIRSSEGTNDWKDLRAALDRRGVVLDFLRELPSKDRLQFDLDYSQGLLLVLGHLMPLKRSSQVIRAAVLCDLHGGNTASAITNLHGGLSLVRLWNREPVLISQMIRISMLQIFYSVQWELLQAKDLSDSQLEVVQTDWERVDLLNSMEEAFVAKRVLGTLTIEQYRTSNSPAGLFSSREGTSRKIVGWWENLKISGRETRDGINFALWKSSWSYDDQLCLYETEQMIVSALRQIRTNGFYKDAIAENERQMKTLTTMFRSDNRFRVWMTDSMGEIGASPEWENQCLTKLMAAAVAKHLAITAIALKRFKLKHNQLPTHLDELAPDFLKAIPRDPVDGQPLRYHMNNDHSFTLYSIGENGIDDGGSATNAEASKSFSWQRGVDWVWPQPATAAEVEAFLLTH
ncbi:MAG TPA: hypothetical protein VFW05_17840 [Verrucomicrobiae bacterium]|nr:hypothetical protein [Verrucomicrobiae bacterium]